jgi:hypothetical protein
VVGTWLVLISQDYELLGTRLSSCTLGLRVARNPGDLRYYGIKG